ncbi:MAG TPA: ATP-binding protein [Candidatus Binatia bacterium]|nr:ATP-binding protein [Candidatus Binatia bacterium]
MTVDLTITAKNRLAELERVGHAIAEFGTEHAVSSKALFEINLAVDELLTNTISYGYDGDAEHEIIVRLCLQADELLIEVEDDGRPFDPLTVDAPAVDQSLEDRRVGGLGVFLVRKVMDELAYRREHGRNILTMRKTMRAKESAA